MALAGPYHLPHVSEGALFGQGAGSGRRTDLRWRVPSAVWLWSDPLAGDMVVHVGCVPIESLTC